jgi:hypothetical protein
VPVLALLLSPRLELVGLEFGAVRLFRVGLGLHAPR